MRHPQDSSVLMRLYLALKRSLLKVTLSTYIRQQPFLNLTTLFDTKYNMAVGTANTEDKRKKKPWFYLIYN